MNESNYEGVLPFHVPSSRLSARPPDLPPPLPPFRLTAEPGQKLVEVEFIVCNVLRAALQRKGGKDGKRERGRADGA